MLHMLYGGKRHKIKINESNTKRDLTVADDASFPIQANFFYGF